MSVDPVSQSNAVAAYSVQNHAQPKSHTAAASQAPAAPEDAHKDKVQLSPQARAAAGDVDHDGDSH